MTKRRAPLKRKKPLFSHHKHSGKRLPHHHTHYLTLLFFIIFTGFFMTGISHSAHAADILVNAKVPAPLPPSAAVITTPANGASFSTIPIDVQGSCPAGYLIKLFRNDVFSGSTLCALDGSFAMQSDLFIGNNDLIARIYNITDDEGPVMPAVTVTYTPSVTNGTVPSHTADAVPQFILEAESTYKGYQIGDKVVWRLKIVGGKAPYAINVDWGDGQSNVFSRKQAGEFDIEHTYTALDSNTIRITGSDDSGHTVFMQLIAVENTLLRSAASTNGINTPLGSISTETIVWITYILVVIVVVSFWFGEYWEYHKLKSHKPNFHRA